MNQLRQSLKRHGRQVLVIGLMSLVISLVLLRYQRGFEHEKDFGENRWPGYTILAALEHKSYDERMRRRGRRAASDDLLILTIDNESMAQMHWPIKRSRHARVVRLLAEAGAKVVAYDVMFDSPSSPEEDQEFAQAIEQAGNVILAANFADSSEQTDQRGFGLDSQLIYPIAPLEDACLWTGFIPVAEDLDAFIRSAETLAYDHVFDDTQPFFAPLVAGTSLGMEYEEIGQWVRNALPGKKRIPYVAGEGIPYRARDVLEPVGLVEELRHPTGGVTTFLSKQLSADGKRAVADFYLFSPADFERPAALVKKLGQGKDPLSKALRKQFSPRLQESLKSWKGGELSPKLLRTLADELNGLLKGKCLYDEKLFADRLVSDEALSMIQQGVSGGDLIRVNRMLVQQAYDTELTVASTAFNEAIAADLNRVILGKSVYTAARFKDLELPGDLQRAVKARRKGLELHRLNRRLLDEALVGLVARMPSETQTLINFVGPPNSFRTLPYWYLAIDPEEQDEAQGQKEVSDLVATPEARRKLFEGKIVLIGGSADELQDNKPTPFFREGKMPGVEVHANTIQMFLEQNYLRRAPSSLTTVVLLTMAFITGLITVLVGKPVSVVATQIDARFSFTVRGVRFTLYGLTWFLLYFCGAMLPPVILFAGVNHWLFCHRNLVLPLAYPLVAMSTTYFLGLFYMFLTEEQERKRMHGRFQRFVAPSVLSEIVSNAEEVPRPKKVNATLIFTDLQGFTTLSEQMEPEEVVEVLNEYLDRMTNVVFKHAGTIDKFIGDAIMVIFGAPIPQDDHPLRALRCAVEMQEECSKFRAFGREKGWPDFFMRIGIHSDDVVVGSIGSKLRVDYTAIGDGVNLAARLEAANKNYGTWIMCSKDTLAGYEDQLEVEYLDALTVKGKTEAVDVYRVLRILEEGQPVGYDVRDVDRDQENSESAKKAKEAYGAGVGGH